MTVETLCMMDSLDMTEEDRAEILRACRESPEERLVITHGTDTMVETAAYLARGLAGSGLTVVLTGAMIPFAFGSSDGLFNLGSALSFAQVLDQGLRRHERPLLPWNDVRKNRELGIFEALG
ncbi:MAG: asparaginase domain-containing protein [Thermoanaerobaculia bacterium]